MTKREKKERLALIVERLKEIYPSAECALEYGGDPWKLLVMGRLSAQCTDARVNIVCRELFEKFPTAESMAYGDIGEIERIIKPCGLFRMKAANIKDASLLLVEKYGGNLPDTMEELLTFAGVGRKIANLLLGDVFRKPAVVCDTHCIRICGRLGMYPETEKNPEKIERILKSLIDEDEGSNFCHRIVIFGREICTARAPECVGCPLSELCEHNRRLEVGKDGKQR
jgi:endonuclease-3